MTQWSSFASMSTSSQLSPCQAPDPGTVHRVRRTRLKAPALFVERSLVDRRLSRGLLAAASVGGSRPGQDGELRPFLEPAARLRLVDRGRRQHAVRTRPQREQVRESEGREHLKPAVRPAHPDARATVWKRRYGVSRAPGTADNRHRIWPHTRDGPELRYGPGLSLRHR
jgi:hypothetical protein